MPIGVLVNEKDESLYVNSTIVSPILAIIGTATKGPVNTPTLCTSQKDFKNKFGLLNPKAYGTYAAQWYLQQVSRVYYIRVADSTTAAKATVTIPGTSTTSTTISDLIKLETVDVGTYYTNYVVIVSNATTSKFDLTIKKSVNGNTLYTFKDVTLDSNSNNYIGTLLNNTFINLKEITDVNATVTNGTYTISGGNNGFDDIKDEIVSALDSIKSSNYQLDLLSIPGVSDAAVIQAALTTCEYRGDTLYLVDPPANLTFEEVADWCNGSGSYDDHTQFNSSFGACYWAWQYVYDEINDQEVLVPPSVVVAPAIARSESISKPWFAPAGLTRGLIKNVLRSEHAPDATEVEYLYDTPNCINSIITHETSGLTVWGQKTLWRNDTALDRVNVRRLVTYIKRIVKRTCQFLVFEPNDSTTWIQFEDLLDPVFRSLVQNRGLYEYKIVPLKHTVSDDDINNSRMPAQILIKPTKSAEYIPIDIVLTSTGVEFSSYISNLTD